MDQTGQLMITPERLYDWLATQLTRRHVSRSEIDHALGRLEHEAGLLQKEIGNFRQVLRDMESDRSPEERVGDLLKSQRRNGTRHE